MIDQAAFNSVMAGIKQRHVAEAERERQRSQQRRAAYLSSIRIMPDRELPLTFKLEKLLGLGDPAGDWVAYRR